MKSNNNPKINSRIKLIGKLVKKLILQTRLDRVGHLTVTAHRTHRTGHRTAHRIGHTIVKRSLATPGNGYGNLQFTPRDATKV